MNVTGQDRMVVSYMHMQILFKKTTDTQRKRERARKQDNAKRNDKNAELNKIVELRAMRVKSIT